MGGVKKGKKMKNNKTGLAGEINKLLDEINAEHDAVELSPWNLTLDEVLNWCNEESDWDKGKSCLLYTSPSPRDRQKSRMPSSA